jgi:hypothetical protein
VTLSSFASVLLFVLAPVDDAAFEDIVTVTFPAPALLKVDFMIRHALNG